MLKRAQLDIQEAAAGAAKARSASPLIDSEEEDIDQKFLEDLVRSGVHAFAWKCPGLVMK